jgi:biopolymer transport protein TolQ
MQLDPIQLVLEADIVVKAVILLLIIFSITSWSIIIQKILLFRNAEKNIQSFEDFLDHQTDDQRALQKASQATLNPAASIYVAFNQWLDQKQKRNARITSENAGHQLDRLRSQEVSFLQSRIAFLATTGNAAPFIGLFGTVWGIMNSFLSIGAKGATNLAVVAPGIAEALIATAIGLVAAIPAVIGYNYCVNRIQKIDETLDDFNHKLLEDTQA